MILDDTIAIKSLASEKRYAARNTLLLKHIHQVCFYEIKLFFIFSLIKA
jgi:hypothetical protein